MVGAQRDETAPIETRDQVIDTGYGRAPIDLFKQDDSGGQGGHVACCDVCEVGSTQQLDLGMGREDGADYIPEEPVLVY